MKFSLTPRVKGYDLVNTEEESGEGYPILGGVPQTPQPPYTVVVGFDQDHMHGQDIKGYFGLKREGHLLPITNFKHEVRVGRMRCPVYSWEQPSTGDSYERANAGPSSAFIPFDFNTYVPDDPHRFVRAAAAKMNSGIADPLTFIAEWASLRRMFSGLLETLIKKVPSGPLSLTDKWLELRYGWRPLLNDINNFVEAWNNNLEGKTRLSERIGENETFSAVTTFEDSAGSPGKRIVTVEDTVTVSSRGYLIADFVKDRYQINPIATGWEIIPFSFVIDWFIDVGVTIQAATFLARSPSYYASIGWKIEYSRSFSSVNYPEPGYNLVWDVLGWERGYQEIRSPVTVSLSPSISINLDFLKGLDLLALIRQRVR